MKTLKHLALLFNLILTLPSFLEPFHLSEDKQELYRYLKVKTKKMFANICANQLFRFLQVFELSVDPIAFQSFYI